MLHFFERNFFIFRVHFLENRALEILWQCIIWSIMHSVHHIFEPGLDRCDTIADINLFSRYNKRLHKELTGEEYYNDQEEEDDFSAFDPSKNLEDMHSQNVKSWITTGSLFLDQLSLSFVFSALSSVYLVFVDDENNLFWPLGFVTNF